MERMKGEMQSEERFQKAAFERLGLPNNMRDLPYYMKEKVADELVQGALGGFLTREEIIFNMNAGYYDNDPAIKQLLIELAPVAKETEANVTAEALTMDFRSKLAQEGVISFLDSFDIPYEIEPAEPYKKTPTPRGRFFFHEPELKVWVEKFGGHAQTKGSGYDYNGLAKRFAEGAETGGTGDNRMFIGGQVIYSYGHHFPIALRLKADKIAFFTTRDYSVTTAGHKSIVRMALEDAGYKLIYAKLFER